MTQAPRQTKTYYSTCANLTCWAGKPTVVIDNGQRAVQEAPMIQFSPFMSKGEGAAEPYGVFHTDDPAIQSYLDQRIAEAKALGANSDILDAEAFNRAMMPDDKRIKSLEEQNADLMRRLESSNELLAQLRQQQQQQAKQGR